MAATIKVALVSRTIFYAPVWVAEQNGYFRDEGVEARSEIFDNAEKINEAMHAGQAQIAIASIEALVADAFKGGKYRIVASVAQKPPHFIIAQPGIKTVQELRGKRFGVLSLHEGTTYFVQDIETAIGFKPHNGRWALFRHIVLLQVYYIINAVNYFLAYAVEVFGRWLPADIGRS